MNTNNKRYGIWITTETWNTSSGKDIIGSLEEITTKVKEWNDQQALENDPDNYMVKYEVREYTATCPCMMDSSGILCELINGHEGRHKGHGIAAEYQW